MSFKSTERTSQLPGLYLTQVQNPVVVVEEAGVVDVVDVADVADAEAVETAAETRNKRTNPLRRSLPATDRPARRGNATLNQMVAHTQT